MGNRDNLPIEQFVDKHWDAYREHKDVNSLRSALEICKRRHSDNLRVADQLRQDGRQDPVLLDFIKASDEEQAWRRKVEAYIQEIKEMNCPYCQLGHVVLIGDTYFCDDYIKEVITVAAFVEQLQTFGEQTYKEAQEFLARAEKAEGYLANSLKNFEDMADDRDKYLTLYEDLKAERDQLRETCSTAKTLIDHVIHGEAVSLNDVYDALKEVIKDQS